MTSTGESVRRTFANDDLQRHFAQHGFVVLPFLDGTEVRELLELWTALDTSPGEPFVSTSLFRRRSEFHGVHDLLLRLCGERIGSLLPDHTVLSGHIMDKRPVDDASSAGTVPLHQDWNFVDESTSRGVLVWCPLVDAVERRAPLQVVPGSHTLSDAPRGTGTIPWALADLESNLRQHLVTVPLRAGEAVFYDGALVHASAPNRTSTSRPVVGLGLVHRAARTVHFHGNPDGRVECFDVDPRYFSEAPLDERPRIHVRSVAAVPWKWSAPDLSEALSAERLVATSPDVEPPVAHRYSPAAGQIEGSTPMTSNAPGLGPWRGPCPPEGFQTFPDAALLGTVADRFFDVAEARPQHTAIRSDGRSINYADLHARVLARAAGIDATPAIGNAPVAVCIAHDDELVSTMLAILAAGRIVVVLDPQAPQEQSRGALAQSGATLLIHDSHHAEFATSLTTATDGLGRAGLTVCSLAALDRSGAGAVAGYTPPRRAADDPAMLAFTSGTSGEPKAAVITNAVLLNLVRGATNALGITENDTMPMLFPVSLAVAAYPMFLPLLNGGTLATLDVRSVGLAPLADFFADNRITLAYMAPTVVRFLVDALAGRTFPDLRMIALGGELVDAEVVQLTRDLFGPDLVANGFGTTETGVITLYVVEPDSDLAGAAPAGYPVPDVDLFILDDRGAPVATGEAGEVAIASPHVFAGYWQHPELTGTVLHPAPDGREGWQLYRTGDLGQLDEHGALTVLGRVDTKVKIRGRFVVLGDVEADLHELAAVQDAAVVATTAADGTAELAAAVIPAEGNLDATALRSQLLADREAYRVPSRWVELRELPRLPNGKLDRRAVVDLVEAAKGSPTVEVSGPRSASSASVTTVREVRAVWEELLPGAAVGPDDDFFALGGDSLLAAQMLVRLEHRTGVTVPMGALVHARSPQDLATEVERLRSDAADTELTSVLQDGDPNRPRLWFVHDLQGSAYRVRHLAEALGADQGVASFESPLLAGFPNRFGSLDVFAARYVRALSDAQPDGPYWLAGYSFGGIVAYEMARQLRRDGHEVAFVGVVDVGPGYRGPGWGDKHPPFRPWFGVAKPPAEGSTVSEKVRHYRDMVSASPAGALRHLTVRTGLAERVDPLRFAADLKRHGRVRPEWRLWYAWEEHWKLAATAWNRANTYDGTVDLFWADETPSADASMGWGPLAGDLQIHRFAGDHLGILEPRGAAALGEALRAVIDDTIQRRTDHHP